MLAPCPILKFKAYLNLNKYLPSHTRNNVEAWAHQDNHSDCIVFNGSLPYIPAFVLHSTIQKLGDTEDKFTKLLEIL